MASSSASSGAWGIFQAAITAVWINNEQAEPTKTIFWLFWYCWDRWGRQKLDMGRGNF
jgi:hypothetical protein